MTGRQISRDWAVEKTAAPSQVWGKRPRVVSPGRKIRGFDDALEKAKSGGKDFRYVQPTHEEIASFMATAHAKFIDDVGVCIATSGPGAIHLLNGLYDARGDNAPVVAIVGQQARVAKAQRCPTVVIRPADVQRLHMEEPTAEHFVSRTGIGHPSTRVTPPASSPVCSAKTSYPETCPSIPSNWASSVPSPVMT